MAALQVTNPKGAIFQLPNAFSKGSRGDHAITTAKRCINWLVDRGRAVDHRDGNYAALDLINLRATARCKQIAYGAALRHKF